MEPEENFIPMTMIYVEYFMRKFAPQKQLIISSEPRRAANFAPAYMPARWSVPELFDQLEAFFSYDQSEVITLAAIFIVFSFSLFTLT